MTYITHEVEPHENGYTVGRLLRGRLGVSASLLRRLKLMPDGITLDGNHVTVRATACMGQMLRIKAEGDSENGGIVPVAMKLDVVYEDEYVLIICKPAGMPTHPSRGHYTDTLANGVIYRLGEGATFRAINRLDSNTSGLLCVAKNSFAAMRLSAQLKAGSLKRTYLAVVEGDVHPREGVIDLPIARVPGRGIMRRIDEDGERAVTRYRVTQTGGGRSLLEISLDTGRTHQIRVHFSHIGHPVSGDFMYGEELPGLPGHALHSHTLRFNHPVSGGDVLMISPPPAVFDALLCGEL